MTLCMVTSGLAQTPKPLKLMVPFPAGGTADVLPRLLAEKMRAQFPSGVVVENKAGAGGNIGRRDHGPRHCGRGSNWHWKNSGVLVANRNALAR